MNPDSASRSALPAAWQLYTAFFACAVMLGSWYPRIPDVQRFAGLEGWELGFGLAGYPTGTLLLFTFGTRWAAKLSFSQSFRIVVPTLGIALVGATLAGNVASLFACMAAAGALQGVLAVTGNVVADQIEAALDRPVLVRAHGFYSVATVVAGAAGIGFRALDVAPWLHLTIALPVATILVVVATFRVGGQRSVPRTDEYHATIVLPTGPIFMLFLAGGAALYLDNAASDWSGILLRDGYAADATTVTAAVTAWAIGQAAGRLGFPNLSSLFGKERLALILAMIAAMGLALVVFSPAIFVAFVGLFLLGIGTSALFPMAIAAAARIGDRPAATNVSSLSQLAFVAGIATPIVLGGLVQIVGVRWAFASGAVMLAASLAVQILLHPFATPSNADEREARSDRTPQSAGQ
ncbi:MFS transporter [Devosia sediminis]|uniref:MFS transporter n=1 Tax=Devosia sediminis TaxID=2798801 RepID=A0A934IWJ3_9HYPH|nr:MFS transporter [Devosia sediminis]MBJ3783612.1 MFS transporter [Devosia sediminis]